MKTLLSIVVSILILFTVSGCQTKRGTNEVDIVIKTFALDTNCIYYQEKVKYLSIVSLIDSDSLVFNYILLHSKNKIDTSKWCWGENLTFIRKEDSLFRVLFGSAAYPYIYSTDTLKMYVGQMNGSSNESWRVNEYRLKLFNDNHNLFSLINNKFTKRKRTFNLYRDFSKNGNENHHEKLSPPPPPSMSPIYIEGDSCDIIKSNGGDSITMVYYCTDKYPNNPCSPDNNRGHRKTILQLEGLLLKHIYMVQEEGVVIKLIESNEKIENPYEVAKFLISRAYYHLPEDKSIHRLTFE